jgi:inner membrane protein
MTERSKRHIGLKGIVVTLLTVMLLVPAFIINNLVSERRERQYEAFSEISSKWAETQTLTGPIVSIPYVEFVKDNSGYVRKERRYIHILPDQLTVNGNVTPEKRYRGIFEVVVYNARLTFSGSFSNLAARIPSIPQENILFNEAFVSFGISDLRGIKDKIQLKWGDETASFYPGIETSDILKSGINSPLIIRPGDSANAVAAFSFSINLNGSQYLHFTPVGKETDVHITSNWTAPSFDGAFLPDKREVKTTGFTASWKVLHLNRNYPQSWLGSGYLVDNSAFGINMILPVDNYTKTDRSIKYAILIIGLTFVIFFFLELLNNKSIHPLQYILVGFALCIFYILLLSISERLNFNLAYLIASVMTIGLISWYANSILKERKLSMLVGGNLILLYGFLFTIIQLQDYALLMGSLGLFIILAVVMYYSRKIDWTGVKKE